MKAFIKKILIFISPIVIGLGLLEYGMRRCPNVYMYKRKIIEERIHNVQIWTFGSSHGLYGIDPHFFTKEAINSAYVSQTLLYDTWICKKYLNCSKRLEWCVFPVSYLTLPDSFEESEEWWRVKNYCIYYDCPYHRFDPRYHLEVVGNPLPYYKQVQRVLKYAEWKFWKKKHVACGGCDSLGFDHSYSKENRSKDNWWSNGEARVKHHTKDLDARNITISENIQELESVIKMCNDKNISVLLVSLPVCYSYSDGIDSTQYALMIKTCESLEIKYKNVYYLNLFEDSRFILDDFFDADHLNTDGAKKVTKIIDEFLNKN